MNTKKNKNSKKPKIRKQRKMHKEIFDDSVVHRIKVTVRLGPGKTESFEMDIKPVNAIEEGRMTYDHVEMSAMDEMDTRYPHDYYPKCRIDGFIMIKDDNGGWSPVVSESDTNSINDLKKSHEYDRFLVLPDAVYSLTPEFKLYLSMVKNGTIDENKVEYDYDVMHRILTDMNSADKAD